MSRFTTIEALEPRQLFNAVTGFTLFNPATDQPVGALRNGHTVNLADFPDGKLNVRVDTDNRSVQSVRIGLDKKPNFAIENGEPYAVFSDNNGDYFPGTLAVGSHTLKATPYSRDNATGNVGTSRTIQFKVVNQPRPQVSAFLLIDADTDQVIEQIDNGDMFNLATLSSRNLNIEVKTTGTASSVRIRLDGSAVTENTAPWAYFRNDGSDFKAGALSVGSHALTATAFTANNAGGFSGAAVGVSFSVVDEPVVPPPPPPTTAGPFVAGDFTTIQQGIWDVTPILQTPQPFSTTFPLGIVVGIAGVSGRYSILLTNGSAVQGYLATAGTPVALTSNHFNPTLPHGGIFGGEVTALFLNVGFSDTGVLAGTFGVPFGDLVLTNLSGLPALEGVSVRDFASLASRALGGDATGFSLNELSDICSQLNGSFLNGPLLFGPSDWAQSHLRPPP